VFYQIKGCESCRGTGYKGRKAIIELVELDDDISAMFIDKVPVSSLKKKAKEAGSIFLREAAILEVLSGVTTLEEANRVTFIGEYPNSFHSGVSVAGHFKGLAAGAFLPPPHSILRCAQDGCGLPHS
jgi:hypothetical protein